jgi:pentatricopeptide repeat protein
MSHHRAKRPSDSAATVASPAAKRARAPSAPAFPTNKEAPDLPSKTRIFCDILASRADDDVDAALDKADIRGVTTADVEQVLRLSYAHPCAATAFFHWAGNRHLGHEHHSPYSWNLVVDILGTNRLFARMWDAVDSMHSRRLLSLDTFASVFSSLAASPGCSPLEAFMDMPRYGMTQDTPALNSLLSALCRADRLDDARAEAGTRPDADSYAILLEGCEAAADPRAARDVFDEMVRAIGFDPDNVPAYDAFLTTLVSSDSSTALPEAMY